MHSRTKVALDRADLETVVAEVLGTDSPVVRVEELTDGMFNTASAITLADGTEAVLKVAPPAGVPLLTYERDLMRAEIDFYQRVAGVVAVPAVLGTDLSRTRVPRDLFLMERLHGRPLRAVRRTLPTADRAAVQHELGALVGRLRAVTGTRFGYDRPDGALSADTWPEAFRLMMAAVLDDAARFGVRLPRSRDRVLALVDAATPALAGVREPVLTHFDLWEGNVFVVPHEGGHHIEAVVDGERAFWGDPLAELVSTSLFTDPRRATDFLAGLAEATGRPLVFSPEVQTRLGLYRAYLCTVMAVEGVPRGYRGAEAFATRRFALWRLAAELRAVERLVRG